MPPEESYPIPARTTRVEDDVKKSRFVATAAYTPTVAAARAFIDSVRAEFDDATHNCWAYVVGGPGTTSENGSSDDGEPGGSAGIPMLGALLGSGVGDITVVVTRYFGGVKLGRGGLVRAYGGSVRHVLRALDRGVHVTCSRLRVIAPFTHSDAVHRTLDAHAARIEREEFGDGIELTVIVAREDVGTLDAALRDAAHGSVRFEVVDESVG